MLSTQQAVKAGNWLEHNFGEQVAEQTAGTPWTLPLVKSIFCKETAPKVLLWIDSYSPDIILQRCVFDTSGEPEFPAAPRSAFPKNRYAFEAKYGDDILSMLVAESNHQRAMPQAGDKDGWSAAPYLAKGYGLFQYDLQNILTDKEFFTEKRWYYFSECLHRLILILNQKAAGNTSLHDAVMAYNGSGARAQAYAGEVMQYYQLFSSSLKSIST